MFYTEAGKINYIIIFYKLKYFNKYVKNNVLESFPLITQITLTVLAFICVISGKDKYPSSYLTQH